MEQQVALVIMPGGKVTLTGLGDTLMTENGWCTDTLHRGEDGLLLAHGAEWGRNFCSPDLGTWWRVSTDGGGTWLPYVKTDDRGLTDSRRNSDWNVQP